MFHKNKRILPNPSFEGLGFFCDKKDKNKGRAVRAFQKRKGAGEIVEDKSKLF
jgi:hypothetical protein